MNKLNYNEILDLILAVLLLETPDNYIEYNMIFTKHNKFYKLSNRDKFAIIQKLIDDGYVKQFEIENNNIQNYYITLSGILFFDNGKGGYVKQKRNKKLLSCWNYTKNVILILGTISAFILAVLEINEKTNAKSNSKECEQSQTIESKLKIKS